MVELCISRNEFHKILKFCIDNNMNVGEIFTLHVKNKTYTISKVYTFLSSTILDEFLKNKMISSFNVDIDDPKYLFKNIISLLKGETIIIDSDDFSFYFHAISVLKIESVYQQFQLIFNEELKSTNCIDFLNSKQFFNLPINNEIKFISKNFSNFESKDILNIDKDTIIQILKNKKFIINNDNDFFRLIKEAIQKNQDYKVMLDYVHYENLSNETLSEAVNNEIVSNTYIFENLKSKINKNKYIQDIYDFLSNNEFKKEYQETFIDYCIYKNDINLMDTILRTKGFDFNHTYNILLFFMVYIL